jgi:hydrogenase nickel incorporation protein HypB
MCTVCGCDDPNVKTGDARSHADAHHDHRDHEHGHDHRHSQYHPYGHGHDHTPASPVPKWTGTSEDRVVQVERDILAKNDAYAAENRSRLAKAGIFALNFVSSPGAGKTTLLVRTINDLKARHAIEVIEGDQQTSNDAERIRATGVPAIQVNTGKGCHLDAHMVGHALNRLPLQSGGLLFIENVGNLICPAAFDLGETHKVVMLSVTEGEDKPVKYPDIFAASDLMLITKFDLLAHIEFDVALTIEYARRVNHRIEVLLVSARSGEGLAAFYAWLDRHAVAMNAKAAE